MSTPPRVNKLKEAMQGMASVTPIASATPTGVPAAETPRQTDIAPSRRGKRVVSAYVNPAAAKQLRLLSVELDTSTQALIEEALNDLFRKHNRSAVA